MAEGGRRVEEIRRYRERGLSVDFGGWRRSIGCELMKRLEDGK